MPHSAKVGYEDAIQGNWGYYYESWSGIDYIKLAQIGLTIMPMVYWDN